MFINNKKLLITAKPLLSNKDIVDNKEVMLNYDFFNNDKNNIEKLTDFLEKNFTKIRELKKCYKLIKVIEFFVQENIKNTKNLKIIERVIKIMEDNNKGSEIFFKTISEHFINISN